MSAGQYDRRALNAVEAIAEALERQTAVLEEIRVELGRLRAEYEHQFKQRQSCES